MRPPKRRTRWPIRSRRLWPTRRKHHPTDFGAREIEHLNEKLLPLALPSPGSLKHPLVAGRAPRFTCQTDSSALFWMDQPLPMSSARRCLPDQESHPQERPCWQMAAVAFERLRQIDIASVAGLQHLQHSARVTNPKRTTNEDQPPKSNWPWQSAPGPMMTNDPLEGVGKAGIDRGE